MTTYPSFIQPTPGHYLHHELLHLNSTEEHNTYANPEKEDTSQITMCDATVQTNAANVLPNVYRGTTALPVVAVVVHRPNGKRKSTYALLDQASEASFIHSSLAKDLHLKGIKGTLSIKSLTGSTSINAERVTVTLESASRNNNGSTLLA